MRKILTFILLIICLNVSATDYYVTTTGNNANDGLGSGNDHAWLTVVYACATVTAGSHTIYVGNGVFLEADRCRLAAGVNLTGNGIGITTIKANYTTTDYQYALVTCISYAEGTNGNQTISGITFDGNNRTGVYGGYVQARSNVIFSDCEFKDFEAAGVTFNARTDLTAAPPTTYATGNQFINCTITNCAKWSGFGRGALQMGGQDGLIVDSCNMSQLGRTAGTNGYVVKYFCNGYLKNIEINNCTINKEPYSAGTFNFAIELWNILGGFKIHDNNIVGNTDLNMLSKGTSAYSLDFYRNIVGDTFQPVGIELGIELESGTAVGCSDAIIRENTFRNLHNAVNFYSQANSIGYNNIRIHNNIFDGLGRVAGGGYGFYHYTGDDSSTPIDSVLIDNNTFVGRYGIDASYGIVMPQNATTTNFIIRNNIITGFATAPIYTSSELVGATIDVLKIQNNDMFDNGNDDDALISGITPTNYTNSNNIKTDPLFKSTTDLHLQTTSPAKNTGIDIGLTTDYSGHRRPYNRGIPDIGAYEWGQRILMNLGKIEMNDGKIVVIEQ